MNPDPANNDARFLKTVGGCDIHFSKEQEDIAVAVAALQIAVVNERKLTEALRSWTIHGLSLIHI